MPPPGLPREIPAASLKRPDPLLLDLAAPAGLPRGIPAASLKHLHGDVSPVFLVARLPRGIPAASLKLGRRRRSAVWLARQKTALAWHYFLMSSKT